MKRKHRKRKRTSRPPPLTPPVQERDLTAAEKAVLAVVREIPDGLMGAFAVAAARRAGAKDAHAVVQGLVNRRYLAYQKDRFHVRYHPGSRAREYWRMEAHVAEGNASALKMFEEARLAGARSGKTAMNFEEVTGVPLHPEEDDEAELEGALEDRRLGDS